MSTFFIGDIHGQAAKLKNLLAKVGFREINGVWSHPTHRAVFVGDFVDRGPGQLETIAIVRNMMEAGFAKAVMGNHELNACAWYLPHPEMSDSYCRPRSEKNRAQHAAFLAETEHDAVLHKELIDWFLTLPLWLETPQYRVVHACWHPGYMAALSSLLAKECRLDYDLVAHATNKDRMEFVAVEAITKGMEVNLPDGVHFYDKENHKRTTTRVTWWDPSAVSYKAAAVVSHDERDRIPDIAMPTDTLIGYDNAKPLFIGHYWRSGIPSLLTSHIACVDYSAGKGGPLVAYRWDGEAVLNNENFVSTDH